MARFGYHCRDCGYFEANLPMGKAPDLASHPVFFGLGDPNDVRSWEMCPEQAVRIIHMPHFVEDKRRFRTGISPVTRLPYAQSRAEEKKIEQQLGIEFVSPQNRPQEWKEAEQYSRHLSKGGNPVEWKAPVAKQNEKGWLLREVEKRAKA